MPVPEDHRELAAILSAAGYDLAEDELQAVLEFLAQTESLDDARQALNAMSELKRVA